MKKIVSFAMVVSLVLLMIPSFAFADEADTMVISQSVEFLENGDYIVTQLSEPVVQQRSGKTGTRSKTYFTSANVPVFEVAVTGVFTYMYGSSVTADSSTATVRLLHQNAAFVSKSAYTSGNTAYATGTVSFNGAVKTISVSLSCDKYGNLS